MVIRCISEIIEELNFMVRIQWILYRWTIYFSLRLLFQLETKSLFIVNLLFYSKEFSDYGCMLEIRDVQYFPDGRSVVDTIGGRRFKVLSRGKRDGYSTAKVEFLSDKPAYEEELQSKGLLIYFFKK